jgi:cellulose synthase/poly-beta-1,6-N-acetylglucosamine synthase-like glycosyltransferase
MPISMLAALFWVGILWTIYAYVGFPLLVTVLARFRRAGKSAAPADATLPVTIVIPAYNEERNIEMKIRNAREADYPGQLLEVMVVSDASTDRTNEIVRSFASSGVRLIEQETRRGKTAGLNRAVDTARGEIIVFTDANAAYAQDTIANLVRHFADPRVGLVSGFTKYTRTDTGTVAEATNAYTSLEVAIKKAESRWGGCVGADGAIFAMRRALYRPLRDDDINDFVLPLDVIEQGYKCLFDEESFCSENPGKNLESEFRRQSRITNRSLRAIWRRTRLLNPVRFPAFAFFLFSHKVVRFLAPVFLFLSGVSLVMLAPQEPLYTLLAAVMLLTLAVVTVTQMWPRLVPSGLSGSRPVRMLNVFALMNLAMLHGWWKFLSGNPEITWQHDRALSR